MVGLVGVKARVQRTGFQVVLARKAMKGRSKSKREDEKAAAPCPLNCPILDPSTGGRSNPSVRMGRSPAHVQGF